MPCSSLAAIWSFASLLIIGETFFGHFDLHCRFLLSNAFPMTNPLPRNFYSPFSCTHLHICRHTGLGSEPSSYPDYILALHSSKRLLAEQLSSSYHLLVILIIIITKHPKHLTGGLDHIVDSGERSTARGERGDDRLLSHQGDRGARNRDDCDCSL